MDKLNFSSPTKFGDIVKEKLVQKMNTAVDDRKSAMKQTIFAPSNKGDSNDNGQ